MRPTDERIADKKAKIEKLQARLNKLYEQLEKLEVKQPCAAEITKTTNPPIYDPEA